MCFRSALERRRYHLDGAHAFGKLCGRLLMITRACGLPNWIGPPRS